MRAIGIILAGGSSYRMKELSQKRAVCAMPVAGSYRSIDFALSNMTNSHIQKVAVFTQYNAGSLNEHLNSSKWWDFGRKQGGLYVFTPAITAEGSFWYRGTADAIAQNLSFLKNCHEPYVVITSGDCVYKMDYNKMLQFHKEKGAECTIAVMPVSMEEATRMGIMSTDENGAIVDFEEKPKQPKSNLASMGIYIFTWSVLREYLIADEADPSSENDFGKNIIPNFLKDNRPMYAYSFEGYWKDVGTLDSLWDANMDLLDPKDPINMRDPSFRIYARNYSAPATRIGSGAKVTNSFVAEGCTIRGNVEHSVLYTGCQIEEGAIVTGAVIMPNTIVRKGANVSYCIVGEQCVVEEGAKIGERPENYLDGDWGIAVVGHQRTIAAGSVIKPKEIV